MKAAFSRATLAQRSLLTLALAAVLLIAPGQAQKPRQSEVDLQAAIRTQTVDGDLKAAIAQYAAIAKKYEKSDRATTAQALVHMAECYEKQGDAEAKKIYERVVREFGDQAKAVATVRTRLGSQTLLPHRGDRVVWSGPEMFGDGRVSPDGRFISYTDYHATGNLVIYDIATGKHRPLTGNRDWSTGSAYTSAFSVDGKQLVYGWRTFSSPQDINELRIVSLDGTGIPQPRRVFGNEEVNGVYPTDWSPDGQWIAVVLERKDRSKQIGLVRAQDGSYRGLRTVGWHGPAKIFFSPDGKFLVYDLPAGDKVNQRDIFMIALDGSKETRVIEHPGQDIVIGWSAIGRELLFASDRNGQKGLWAVPVSDGRPTGDPVLLKPDIGAASSLGLTSSGVLHLMKDASTTRLQMVPIDLAKGKVVGAPVVENYVNNARPDWSRDGKYIAYASIGSSGVRTLFIRSLQSGELRELRPPLDYYNWPRWMPDGKSLLMFARDLTGRSGIYRVDARNGDTSLVINNESFTRVQVSPDGTKIYYNVDAHGPSPGPAKYVERDLNSGNTRILFEGPKGKTGHVELSPDGEHLALIVQGDDGSAVILVPVSGGEPRELYKSKSFPGRGLRGFGGLSWTPGSSAILVAGNAGFWLISLKDRKPRRLDIDLNVSEFRLAPDGRHIATNAGESLREIWALENFLPTQTASNK